MLEELGLGEAPSREDADVLVFNTCTIREKPDQRFAAHMARRGCAEAARPGHDRRRRRLLRRGAARAALRALPVRRRRLRARHDPAPRGLDRRGRRRRRRGRVRHRATERSFSAALPMHRERAFQAWVQVSMGCNSTCAYCIVPAVRGREVSRRPGEIVAEVTALAREGVREVTLLGQNVNSWGRDLRPAIATEFGELLRAVDAVDGIERIRFTSPHPKDFREPVIAAMAECDAVCEHVHLPLQSGSSRVLKSDAADVLPRALPRARRAAPRRDSRPRARHGHHRRLPRRDRGRTSRRRSPSSRRCGTTARSRSSTRRAQGTEAAAMPDQVPDEREARAAGAARRSRPAHRRASGTPRASAGVEEVLVEGPSRTDPALLRGRTRRNTTVNFQARRARRRSSRSRSKRPRRRRSAAPRPPPSRRDADPAQSPHTRARPAH